MMPLTQPGQTGTQALLNDPNAKRILQNRSGALGSQSTTSTISRPSSQRFNPSNVVTTQPKQQVQPTTAVTTKQSFVNPVNSKQAGMLITAKQFVGTPYKWGGTSPNGWDCSGFTQYVARQNGQKIPRTASAQYSWFAKQGRLTKDFGSAKPGDLLYFRSKASPSGWHTGIYIGNGKMIDAAGKKSGTKISNVGGRTLLGVGVM